MPKKEELTVKEIMYDIYNHDFSKYEGKSVELLKAKAKSIMSAFTNRTLHYLKVISNESVYSKEYIAETIRSYNQFKAKNEIYPRIIDYHVETSHTSRLGVPYDINLNSKNSLLKVLELEKSELEQIKKIEQELYFWYLTSIDMYLNTLNPTQKIDINRCGICNNKLTEDKKVFYKTSLGYDMSIDMKCGLNYGLHFVTKENVTSTDFLDFLDSIDGKLKSATTLYKRYLKEKAL